MIAEKTIIDRTRIKAASMLACGDSFALVRLPGHAPKLITGQNGRYECFVTPWRQRFGQSLVIAPDASAPSFWLPAPTEKPHYLKTLRDLIATLQKRGRCKTVISRVISGQSRGLDWIEAAERLWSTFPNSFGYLFYTPSTGAWLGASPEKLLLTYPPNHFSTQALAGTLRVEQPWNLKNYEEQQLVEEFIERALTGTEHDRRGPSDCVYGDIKHLSTAFAGTFRGENPFEDARELLDALAPTPALAGYPREQAFADIEAIELHERGCYGGYITVVDRQSDRTFSYVTIRCVQFDPRDDRWAVYAGGGITPKSDPEVEWAETSDKASKLIKIISL